MKRIQLLNLLVRILADDATRSRLQQEGKEIKGFHGLVRVFLGHFHHLTLYNPLGLLAGVAFTASIFRPWWHAGIHEGTHRINAYAFILSHDLPSEGMKYIIETPLPAVVILLLVLSGYLFLVFWGSTMAGRKGKFYIAWSGVFMLVYVAGFYGSLLFACYRIGEPVSGQFTVQDMVEVIVHTYFLPPYYYAIGAGILCLISSLTHGWVSIRFYTRKKGIKRE